MTWPTRIIQVFLLLVGVSAQTDGGVFPTQKVLKMLGLLRREIDQDLFKEQKQFDSFSANCEIQKTEGARAIEIDKDKLDEMIATVKEKEATRKQTVDKLLAEKKHNSALKEEWEEITKQHKHDLAEYTASEADLSHAIHSLESVIKVLNAKRPESFVELGESVQKTLAVASRYGLAPKGEKAETLQAFMQQARQGLSAKPFAVDPSNPDYVFHSDALIDIIQELLVDFNRQYKQLTDDWGRQLENYEAMIGVLNEEIARSNQIMDKLNSAVEDLNQDILQLKRDILYKTKAVQEDTAYHKMVLDQCRARTKDWEQRSSTRKEEIKTIDEAMELLAKFAGHDMRVNRLRMKHIGLTESQKQSGSVVHAAVSLLQAASHKESSIVSLRTIEQDPKEKVLSHLRNEAQRLNSEALSMLAMHVAEDPFIKVKDLILSLTHRLEEERKAETNKQSYCNTEQAKANNDRDNRFNSMNKINSKLHQLETHLAALDYEIDRASQEAEEKTHALEEEREDHRLDREEDQRMIDEAHEGMDGVGQALNLLKDFYRKSAHRAERHDETLDAKLTIDEKHRYTRADAGFQGSYAGRQEESVNIIGMLEVIVSDFKTSINVISTAMDKAQRDFVNYERETTSAIAAANTSKQMCEEDKESTDAAIAHNLKDLQTQTSLVDSAIRSLEDLKPVCVDSAMGYQERVSKRRDEIAALGKALCILDTEGVEESCSH